MTKQQKEKQPESNGYVRITIDDECGRFAPYIRGAAVVICSAAILAALSLLIAATINAHKQEEYIVKDKGNRKIAYAPIKNQNAIHIMNCDVFNMDSVVYNNINVGDTILGWKPFLDNLSLSTSDAPRGGLKSTIIAINGKTWEQIKRDNLIRAMHQNVK